MTSFLNKVYVENLDLFINMGARQAGKDDMLLTPKNASQYRLRSVSYYGAKCWNGISLNIKRSPSVSVFRSKLKTYLFENNY